MEKLIRYFEKRIQETERWIERLESRKRDLQDNLDLANFKGQLESEKKALKYVKGGRWQE